MVLGGPWCSGWLSGGDVGEGTNYWISSFPTPVPEGKDMWDSACTAWTRREEALTVLHHSGQQDYPIWTFRPQYKDREQERKGAKGNTKCVTCGRLVWTGRLNVDMDPGIRHRRRRVPAGPGCMRVRYVSGRPVELCFSSFQRTAVSDSHARPYGPWMYDVVMGRCWWVSSRSEPCVQECEEPIFPRNGPMNASVTAANRALMHGWPTLSWSLDSPEPPAR